MNYLLIYQQRRRDNLKRLLANYPTQRHFADAVGLSVAQVSHLVTGVREMGEEIARRIEQTLGFEMGFMDREVDSSGEGYNVNGVSPLSLYLAREIDALPTKQRCALQALVDSMRQEDGSGSALKKSGDG
ncbi:MAG: helix-turn-helix transcriptional regulator [Synechococcaceae cyanobacterium SM1_2_3]|nr:helix-turn-helix transcriptional regulator [Synechococcaceae cyanobacterium SM1_2_3]